MHHGRPVELVELIIAIAEGEAWRVRPLFVDAPDRVEFFRPHDTFKPLHTGQKSSC